MIFLSNGKDKSFANASVSSGGWWDSWPEHIAAVALKLRETKTDEECIRSLN